MPMVCAVAAADDYYCHQGHDSINRDPADQVLRRFLSAVGPIADNRERFVANYRNCGQRRLDLGPRDP